MYRRELSQFVEDELERLLNGTDAEKQRYRNTMNAIERVMADPIHKDFNKTLPDNYKAVDVLQQYRLFFKIINNPSGDKIDVVYFSWINDEESIHASGTAGDAYAIFRDLMSRGKIETYSVPEPIKVVEKYKRFDAWTQKTVYISLNRTTKPGEGTSGAYSTLVLSQVTANDFRIDSVTVTAEDEGLASTLLENLCGEADRDTISLCYELLQVSGHYGKSRHLLEKFGFRWDQDDDGVELWVRLPR